MGIHHGWTSSTNWKAPSQRCTVAGGRYSCHVSLSITKNGEQAGVSIQLLDCRGCEITRDQAVEWSYHHNYPSIPRNYPSANSFLWHSRREDHYPRVIIYTTCILQLYDKVEAIGDTLHIFAWSLVPNSWNIQFLGYLNLGIRTKGQPEQAKQDAVVHQMCLSWCGMANRLKVLDHSYMQTFNKLQQIRLACPTLVCFNQDIPEPANVINCTYSTETYGNHTCLVRVVHKVA